MDLSMPGMGGLQATRLIKAQDAPPRILIASHYDDAEHREHTAQAGADGFISKHDYEHRIAEYVRSNMTNTVTGDAHG
ncbi:MAG TPA: response regulator, partial [Nevskia sp.]|nr:response regulator [Nevskia sp.]